MRAERLLFFMRAFGLMGPMRGIDVGPDVEPEEDEEMESHVSEAVRRGANNWPQLAVAF